MSTAASATALPVPPATDRSAWTGPHAVADPAVLAAAKARATATRDQPWPTPRASDLARYHLDGNRTAYEASVFARSERLAAAVLAAAADPVQAALADALDGVIGLCEQSTWCWPAHDDAHERRGWVLPDLDCPYLDLGASEVAADLAYTDAVLGELLEQTYPGVRERIRREVRLRVLDPFLDRRDWQWLGLTRPAHNWTAWICGNLLATALQLEPDPARRTRAVAEATAGIDRFLAVVPPDGAIDEGTSYWWEGASRALEALDVLRHASGGALPPERLAQVRGLVAFPHRMQLGPEWVASFSDAVPRLEPGRDSRPWHTLHRWARLVGDTDAAAYASRAAGARTPDGVRFDSGLGRLLALATSPEWREAGEHAGSPLPARVWLPSTQVLLARPSAGSAGGLTLLVKGGHNGEAHNHLDVGSVAVALDGVPVVIDLGRATYTAVTFSPERYSEWHVGSAWHSVPAPHGLSQGVGASFGAREVAVTPDGAGLVLELAGVYPGSGLATWRRAARLVASPAPSGDTPGRLGRHLWPVAETPLAQPGEGRGDGVVADGAVEVVDEWGFVSADPSGVTSGPVRRDLWPVAETCVARPGEGASTRIAWVLAGEVEVSGSRAVVHPVGGDRALEVTWEGDVPIAVETRVRELEDPYLRAAWGVRVTRLDLVVGDGGGGRVRSVFRPVRG